MSQQSSDPLAVWSISIYQDYDYWYDDFEDEEEVDWDIDYLINTYLVGNYINTYYVGDGATWPEGVNDWHFVWITYDGETVWWNN